MKTLYAWEGCPFENPVPDGIGVTRSSGARRNGLSPDQGRHSGRGIGPRREARGERPTACPGKKEGPPPAG